MQQSRKAKTPALLCSILFLQCAAMYGARLSEGGGLGISTVGADNHSDYASLREAADDFCLLPGGLRGDWTLIVTSDLVETKNTCFANDTNGFTATIAPALNSSPVITYTSSSDAPIAGNLIIGAPDPQQPDVTRETDNFCIDGWNGVPGRNLTVQNIEGTALSPSVITVYGDSDGVALRNCIISNLASGNSARAFCVTFAARQTADGRSEIPDSGKVLNCELNAANAIAGQGMLQLRSGPIPTGLAQHGLEVRNNDIHARTRGLLLSITGNATVSSNTIRLEQPSNGYRTVGLWHNGDNGSTSYTQLIERNQIDRLRSGNRTFTERGVHGIELSGNGNYQVWNNMICGYDFLTTELSTSGINYAGIVFLGSSPRLDVQFNSISLPSFPMIQTTANRCFGIGWDHAYGNLFSGSAVVRNNIIRIGQSQGTALRFGAGGEVDSEYNVIYAEPGRACVGERGGVIYQSLTGWKAETMFDSQSQELDLFAAVPGWRAPDDLHLSGAPELLMQSPSDHEILYDVDGDIRRQPETLPGCDDLPENRVVAELEGRYAGTDSGKAFGAYVTRYRTGAMLELHGNGQLNWNGRFSHSGQASIQSTHAAFILTGEQTGTVSLHFQGGRVKGTYTVRTSDNQILEGKFSLKKQE